MLEWAQEFRMGSVWFWMHLVGENYKYIVTGIATE